MKTFQTIDDAEKSYLDSVYLLSHSKNTKKNFKTGINVFRKFLTENYNISELEIQTKIKNNEFSIYDILQELIISMDKTGIRATTIKGRLSIAKGYLRHIGIKINSDDIKTLVKVPKITKTREIPITKEIIIRLLRNANPKLQTAILVATSTGLRIGELVQLKISDINFSITPTVVYVRGETTKTRVSRETFLTSETTIALKDYLKRFHKWKEDTKNQVLLEKHIFGPVIKPHKKGKFSIDSSILTLQESLKKLVDSNPDLNVKNENGRASIHFHAFRKFFRTTVGNSVGRDFAEALIGHGFYMDTYYQLTEEKKKEMFLQAEPYVTISDFKEVEKNIKDISIKYSKLENKFNDLLQYLETQSISIS